MEAGWWLALLHGFGVGRHVSVLLYCIFESVCVGCRQIAVLHINCALLLFICLY